MPHSITDKGDYNPFQTAHQARNVRRAHEQALHREKIALARTPRGRPAKLARHIEPTLTALVAAVLLTSCRITRHRGENSKPSAGA